MTHKQFRWGCEKPEGLTLISPIFDNFDTCYDDYCKSMKALRERGVDLATLKWRGVYNLKQIALISMGKNPYSKSIYLDKLAVQDDV